MARKSSYDRFLCVILFDDLVAGFSCGLLTPEANSDVTTFLAKNLREHASALATIDSQSRRRTCRCQSDASK